MLPMGARTSGKNGLGGAKFYSSGARRIKMGEGIARPRGPKGLSTFDKKRDNRNFNTESYDRIYENPFDRVIEKPLSTFSVDVDTASYANARRFLTAHRMPPKDSIRIEEFINYFNYNYEGPSPASKTPFSVHGELSSCPWAPRHKLLRIGIKGKEIPEKSRPNSNLVFLLDVSGSMNSPNKLPLLKQAFKLLVKKLTPRDRIAIVVYAGASGVVLPSTSAGEQQKILDSLSKLYAGGSTNAGAGIEAAYAIAEKHFIPKGINRVILATDGDFNVGTTSRGDLVRMVEKKAKKNIYLTVLGFGMGNYKDSMLETLSGKGNGNYAYIDTISEARKVLVKQMGGTLITIAKDVKIQIEFNPSKIAAYRLIGYENRILAARDFNDDKKDAGEIGAGHMVTALYELIPKGVKVPGPTVDSLKYQAPKTPVKGSNLHELATVKLRHKAPDAEKSTLVSFPVKDLSGSFQSASEDMRFAAAVAGFAMLLRGSEHAGTLTYTKVIGMAQKAMGSDKNGYRKEFISLVKNAMDLKK
ncbi:VWA domain-containing protein [Myxococcota bacterium]|nr:VWA domain-containing protein [Myxococcota bacterium]MBU1533684.1 VWA domain-containing protein [Myxococcota bacterium]